MNKIFHPAIRNGKPVLVEKAKAERPYLFIRPSNEMYGRWNDNYEEEIKEYQQHLASLEVLEVSKELLNSMPELWYQEWGFEYDKQIAIFRPEGYIMEDVTLVEGVDFNITRPFHMEGTQRVQRLVAIPIQSAKENASKPFSTKREWQDSMIHETYEKMKRDYNRLDELEKQIGELPDGVHPDERKPRAGTWLQERACWQSEVEALRGKIKEQELIIYGLEEGVEEWKLKCSDLEWQLSKAIPIPVIEAAPVEDKPSTVSNDLRMNLLSRLLAFSDRYEITIQFWPEQTAVYIAKDGVELQDYGGGFEFAINSSIDYLKRVNNQL